MYAKMHCQKFGKCNMFLSLPTIWPSWSTWMVCSVPPPGACLRTRLPELPGSACIAQESLRQKKPWADIWAKSSQNKTIFRDSPRGKYPAETRPQDGRQNKLFGPFIHDSFSDVLLASILCFFCLLLYSAWKVMGGETLTHLDPQNPLMCFMILGFCKSNFP